MEESKKPKDEEVEFYESESELSNKFNKMM